ncbi:MAG: glycosyltransferase [Candidatus Parvarchaeota archaeon]|nr:glycosyltransferase [Candidatus Parvarchaeota archaeon]
MKKLRIAIYSDDYKPCVDGTVEYIVNLRKELERRGHEVFIVTTGRKATENLKKHDKHLIVYKGVKFIMYPDYTVSLPKFYDKKIDNIAPDIIHSQTPLSLGLSAVYAAKRLSIPLVSTFHTFLADEDVIKSFVPINKLLYRVIKFSLERYLEYVYSKSTVNIALSKRAQTYLNGIGVKNCKLIRTGAAEKLKSWRQTKQISRKHIGIGKNEKVILYLGRVSNEKNLDVLVKAARLLKKKGFTIIIAGKGPALNKYKSLSNKLNTGVIFPGFVDEKLKKYYFRAADIFCNPSKFENASIVNFEAMAAGVPLLIAKDSSQSEYVMPPIGGETFNQESEADLASKAEMMLSRLDKYKPTKILGTFKEHVDKVEELYYGLIDGARKKS